MSKKYRIVEDNKLGFCVQEKSILWPFWCKCQGVGGSPNTHRSYDKAVLFMSLKKCLIPVDYYFSRIRSSGKYDESIKYARY